MTAYLKYSWIRIINTSLVYCWLKSTSFNRIVRYDASGSTDAIDTKCCWQSISIIHYLIIWKLSSEYFKNYWIEGKSSTTLNLVHQIELLPMYSMTSETVSKCDQMKSLERSFWRFQIKYCSNFQCWIVLCCRETKFNILGK